MPGWESTVEAARRIARDAAPSVDRIESEQRLPGAVVDALAAAGILALQVRSGVGGPEADAVTAFGVCDELARVDGSLGWCAMVGMTTSYLTGWLDAEVIEEMFGSPPDVRLAGSTRPLGRARPVAGGLQVTGRWDVASGIAHARWVAAACTVDGSDDVRIVFVPIEHVEVIETWSVMGMRGTGSHDFVLDRVVVPHERTVRPLDPPAEDRPLYDRRLLRVASHAPVAGVVLGIVQGALDALVARAAATATTGSPTPLAGRPAVQRAVAEATGEVASARALALAATEQAWSAVVDAASCQPLLAVARARLSYTHAARAATRAMTLLFDAAGTSGIHTAGPLERRYRDLAVACRFKSFDHAIDVGAGRVLLGLDPQGGGW